LDFLKRSNPGVEGYDLPPLTQKLTSQNSKILDEGGHPNKKGFILLDYMINGYSK
jgi:hypothetical protein